MILIDTTILIDHFRKKDKSNTRFYELALLYPSIAISCITKYEVYIGSNEGQNEFWNNLFSNLVLLPFGEKETDSAIAIEKELIKKKQTIGFIDVAIAATAKANNLSIATLNRKHFETISELIIL